MCTLLSYVWDVMSPICNEHSHSFSFHVQCMPIFVSNFDDFWVLFGSFFFGILGSAVGADSAQSLYPILTSLTHLVVRWSFSPSSLRHHDESHADPLPGHMPAQTTQCWSRDLTPDSVSHLSPRHMIYSPVPLIIIVPVT